MQPSTVLAARPKLLIAIGALSIIGIGIASYVYFSKKKKNEAADEKPTLLESSKGLLKTAESGAKNLVKQMTPECHPQYGQYQLLLIIEANRLDQRLRQVSSISKEDADNIISNAIYAYCFEKGNASGQDVLKGVEYSEEEPINYETNEKVFFQLSLSAQSEIVTGKPDRLDIINALNPNERVEIEKIKKLQTISSIMNFYSII